MALYDTLFAMMDLQASQVLVTPRDFRDETFKVNLRETTEELLSVSRVIPVFNENDAISDRSADKVSGSAMLTRRLCPKAGSSSVADAAYFMPGSADIF